jgi:hypothetical protein
LPVWCHCIVVVVVIIIISHRKRTTTTTTTTISTITTSSSSTSGASTSAAAVKREKQSFARWQERRVAAQARVVAAAGDLCNPLHGIAEHDQEEACMQFGFLPLTPTAISLMFDERYLKDRENRERWPRQYKAEGQWVLLSAGAKENSPKNIRYWTEFLGERPYERGHCFEKNAILGMAYMTPPLAWESEKSDWVDPNWGNAAWVIDKLLKFHAPVRRFDNCYSGYMLLKHCHQRKEVWKHVVNRLLKGDYDWLWKKLDAVGGSPVYIPPSQRR